MATTTNYGWTTPNDTDLVKDGAAAIRTLGSSIDTTTKALNPETTLGDIAYRSATSNTNTRLAIGSAGQVLTVAAGVPSWASPSDQTPLTTKGDVFTFSTVDARLGVGANGTVLTADSAETTGLKWAVDPVADVITTAGDLIYGTAADTVARLGIGTAGQVLQVNSGATAPEWVAAGGASALTLISATTFSAASSHSVDSCFSATYKYYLVLTDFTASTTNTSLNFRLRASSTDTSTNYDSAIGYHQGASAGTETNANGTDEVKFSSNKTSADVISAKIEFYNPNLASQTSFTTHSAGGYGTNRFTWVGGGLQNSTTQFDGFSIYPAAGDITGSIKVYGYAN